MTDTSVGVVGLGAMGAGIARVLAEAGRPPRAVHDVRDEARARAADSGLHAVGSLADLAAACEVVVLSLPAADVVAEVLRELLDAGRDLLVVDTSTIGPDSAREHAETAAAAGSAYVDAPILGRPDLAGRWTIPLGGSAHDAARAAEVLAPVADRIVHVGPSGAAATIKVANNLMFSVINAVTAEALLLVEAAGGDPGVFVDTVIDSGAATVSGLFRSIAPRAVDGDFTPTFSLDLTRKDNALAVDLARAAGVELSVADAALSLHDAAVRAGHGAEDSVSVLRLLEERAGITARRHRDD